MSASLERLRTIITAAPGTLVAIEALWDGDANRWVLDLRAVFEHPAGAARRFAARDLEVPRPGGHDEPRSDDQPASWPEAVIADDWGRTLAAEYGVPFHFPSPQVPERDCAGWAELADAHRCSGCTVAMRAPPPRGVPWRGACNACVHKCVAAGWVRVFVGIAGASVGDATRIDNLRRAWDQAIVRRGVGLMELATVTAEGQLYLKLVVDRDVGVAVVVDHVRRRADAASTTVLASIDRGTPRQVWPQSPGSSGNR